ncbi:MAG: hypothetical protein FVQ83_13815 [Chloroflexi bacterium]|nr:hypothetical protein [Chloroflexota bacterium]
MDEPIPLSSRSSPTRSILLSLLLLSAATLVFEINLTRLFSVSQFYHFAFLIVSLALLGFGASGTTLSIFPRWGQQDLQGSISRLSLAAAFSILGAYLLTNWLPFDSFSITWDGRQLVILAIHFLVLATPFFFIGLVVGLLLSAFPDEAGRTYAVNLMGSAMGCVGSLMAPQVLGGVGTVVFSSGLAVVAGLVSFPFKAHVGKPEILPTSSRSLPGSILQALLMGLLLIFVIIDLSARISASFSPPLFELQLSPYKGISYALQYPGADVVFRKWNSFSRVDLIESPGIRSVPGLSYRFPQSPPRELGLFVDGDDLSPVVVAEADTIFTDYILSSIAFQLRPDANTLILEPRGGLDVLIAYAQNASRITAVESNVLIVEAAKPIYSMPRTRVVIEAGRSFIHNNQESFDVIVFSLTNAYHPVRSGAYSLAEDYRFTTQSFQDALARLEPDGLLVITRWLQVPPSEWLRAFALSISALESEGLDPSTQIVAVRSFNVGLLLIKRNPFNTQELVEIREFASTRAFDLVFAPDIHLQEVNRFNVLAEPLYFQAFTSLLAAQDREDWYASYPYEITPTDDNRPFFGHFFKWSQAGQLLAEMGNTWQPFGGAGYFVLLVLLGLALVMAGVLILLPLAIVRLRTTMRKSLPPKAEQGQALPVLIYFGLIGLAFLQVEIPLIQRFILFLGQPAYALTTVLFALLLFSGVGSRLSHRLPHRRTLAVLVIVVLAIPVGLPVLFELALGLNLSVRVALTIVLLAPLGFLMGVPFPRGIQELEDSAIGLIPWVWGVNGAASVVSSVLAALLALSFGFNVVLLIGALCYAGAWVAAAYFTATQNPYPDR